MDSQRAQADGEKGKAKQCDTIVAFAESETIAIRKENSGVKKSERIVKRLVKIPPQQIRDEVWVSGIGDGIAKVSYPGPHHYNCQAQESKKQERLARQR